MNEKIGTQDQISFVMNGKPVVFEQPKLVCPRCGVDRLIEPCGNPELVGCPMIATT